MAEDLKIGTIVRSARHGHQAWIVAEANFWDVPSIYPGETMPWMRTKAACTICGRFKDEKRKSRKCSCLECKASKRKDNREVYWRLYSIGRKKNEHILTDAEVEKLQGNPNKEGFKYPIWDGNTETLRECTREELRYIRLHKH